MTPLALSYGRTVLIRRGMGNGTSRANKGRNSEASAQARHQHAQAMERLRSMTSNGAGRAEHSEVMSVMSPDSMIAQTERHMQREGKPFVAAELKVILLTLRPTERVHEMRVEDLRRAIRAVIVQTNLDRIISNQGTISGGREPLSRRLPRPFDGTLDGNIPIREEDPL